MVSDSVARLYWSYLEDISVQTSGVLQHAWSVLLHFEILKVYSSCITTPLSREKNQYIIKTAPISFLQYI